MKQKIIKGSINLSYLYLQELPDLSDVNCIGNFNIDNNSVTTLKGSPKRVNNFSCRSNPNLISLEGAPKQVEENFILSRSSKLISLKGVPKIIRDNFFCGFTGVETLKDCIIDKVNWVYFDNNNLKDLQGLENITFLTRPGNRATLVFRNEANLKSFYGAPKELMANLDMEFTGITTLDYAPEYIHGYFNFHYHKKNPPKFTEEDVRKNIKVLGNINITAY